MRREAQELRVQRQIAPAGALVRQHHRTHLIEQQLPRNAAEAVEGALQPVGQNVHRLPRIEAQPQQSRVAEHHQKRVPPSPRQRERPEVHLALAARRGLEADRDLHRIARPRRAHVFPHAAVSARVPGRANFVEQALRRQPRKLPQPDVDHRLVRVELVLPLAARCRPGVPGSEIAVQLPRGAPVVDRAPANPEAPRQLRLRHALVQVVLQPHPRLPSGHTAPPRPGWQNQQGGPAHRRRQFDVRNSRLTKMGDLQLSLTLASGAAAECDHGHRGVRTSTQYPRFQRSRIRPALRPIAGGADLRFHLVLTSSHGLSRWCPSPGSI